MAPDDDPRFSGFHSYADGSPRDDERDAPGPAAVTYWNGTPTYLDDAPPEAPAPDRRPIFVAAGGAAALALVAASGWFLMRDDAPRSPATAPAAPGVQVVVTEPPPPPALPKTDRLDVRAANMAAAAPAPALASAPSPASPQASADTSAAVSAPPVVNPPPADTPALAAITPPAPVRPALRPAPPPRNGFDRCAEAPTAARRMVCGDMRVAAADQRMKEAFAAALDAGVPYRRLALDQDEWMEVRDDAAEVSRGAVLDVYRQRTRELWAMADRQD